jgi:hypothetical protein
MNREQCQEMCDALNESSLAGQLIDPMDNSEHEKDCICASVRHNAACVSNSGENETQDPADLSVCPNPQGIEIGAGTSGSCSAVVHGKFLPDNPTQFDYFHAIRAVASRIGKKQIFDLADEAMNLPNANVEPPRERKANA